MELNVTDELDPKAAGARRFRDKVCVVTGAGQGIGRALLRAAEQRSRAAGASLLRLSVKSGNDAALGLYADEGFEESERQLEKTLR